MNGLSSPSGSKILAVILSSNLLVTGSSFACVQISEKSNSISVFQITPSTFVIGFDEPLDGGPVIALAYD